MPYQMGYVIEKPWADLLSLPWKAREVTQKKIIMPENKGMEEKPSEGYCPLSCLLAMQTGNTGSLQGILCLCLCRGSVWVFEISLVTNFQVVHN